MLFKKILPLIALLLLISASIYGCGRDADNSDYAEVVQAFAADTNIIDTTEIISNPVKAETTEVSEITGIAENPGELYAVTKSGQKFHRPDCRYVRNSENITYLSKEEAEKKYEPCKVCKP